MNENDDDFDPAPERPIAFDQDGRPCLCEPVYDPEPDEPGPDGMDPANFLDMMLTGTASAAVAGERMAILAYLLNTRGEKNRGGKLRASHLYPVPCGPRSLRELGVRLKISHVAARSRVATYKATFAREIAVSLNMTPRL